MKAVLPALLALALAGAASALASDPRDEERSAWAYRRGVILFARARNRPSSPSWRSRPS